MVLTVVAMFISAFSGLLLMLVPGFREMLASPEPTTSALAILLGHTATLACYLFATFLLTRYLDRRPLAVLGLKVSVRSMAALLGATGLAAAVVCLVRFVFQLAGGGEPVAGGPGGVPLALVITLGLFRAFVLQGIGEEVLWRGYVMQSLSARPQRAVWVSAAAFAAMHLISQGGQQSILDHILYLATPFGFALLAGYLAVMTRSVWPAIGIHGGFHTGNMVAGLLGVSTISITQELAIAAVMTALALLVATRITPQRWAEVARRGPFAPAEPAQ